MSPALRSFAAQWETRPADSLSPVREQAMQRFLQLGLPSLRDETWRYTDLRSLAADRDDVRRLQVLQSDEHRHELRDAGDRHRLVRVV